MAGSVPKFDPKPKIVVNYKSWSILCVCGVYIHYHFAYLCKPTHMLGTEYTQKYSTNAFPLIKRSNIIPNTMRVLSKHILHETLTFSPYTNNLQ